MAGMNVPMTRTAPGRRFGSAAMSAPRLVMSWEDWLTFAAALIAFLSVAASIQQANWVDGMPPIIPTALAGLAIGMVAARIRLTAFVAHPVALAVGLIVVILMVQSFADGATVMDRLTDFRIRMKDWWDVVLANDISNDRLPFVTLVHAITFLAAYLAAYSIYRWHNPWIAILPGGIILLANIGLQKGQPSTAFLFFLFGAILLIARLYLQKNQVRWKRLGVDYPEFISLSAGQLTLILAVGLLFLAWLVPVGNQAKRVESVYDAAASPFTGHSTLFNRLFTNVDGQGGGRLHNFGPYLAVKGNVKLGTRRLYEVTPGDAAFIRGTSYEEYTGSGWKTASRDGTKIEGGDLAAASEAGEYLKRVPTILEVKVLDGDNSVLSWGSPLGTNVAVTAETPKGFRGDIEQLSTRRGLNRGDTYNSVGSESVATAEDLIGAGVDYPAWVRDRYLQLPKDVPQRVRDEAKLRAGNAAATPYEKAVNIEAYLRSFPYDLNVEPTPAGRDVADFLLFDLKRGYFDYQSTTMAVMLRSLGIPARVAVGYVMEKNERVDNTTYVIRKDDAYSWVEVFFPKYGWVTFNPTADKPAGGAEGGFGSGASLDDRLLNDPDLQSIFGDAELIDPAGRAAQEALQATPVENNGPPWTLIWIMAGLLAFAAAVTLAGRTAWNWGLGGLEGDVRLWAKAQRFAHWARLGGRPAETANEWSRRVGTAVEKPVAARQLADAYEETRYGRPDLKRSDPEATQGAYTDLRKSLLQRALKSRVPGRRKR